tara:strand:- start:17786 stop:18493 length:708 start_codon:yes stop_codon:yes gene_type:complete
MLESVNVENRGSYGDLFGFSNTLFSGLAFVGVIAAIILQSEELKLQRNELQETRTEFEQQNATLKKQSFENTFYQLILNSNNMLHNINAVTFNQTGKYLLTLHLRNFVKKLKNEIREKYDSPPTINLTEAITVFNNSDEFKKNTYKNWRSISPWVKTVCRIQEFINQSDLISYEEKKLFISIYWNQLSDNQIKMLFILLKFDVIKNKKIIEILNTSPLRNLGLNIIMNSNPLIYF